MENPNKYCKNVFEIVNKMMEIKEMMDPSIPTCRNENFRYSGPLISPKKKGKAVDLKLFQLKFGWVISTIIQNAPITDVMAKLTLTMVLVWAPVIPSISNFSLNIKPNCCITGYKHNWNRKTLVKQI